MQPVQAQNATRNAGETWLQVLGIDFPVHRAYRSSEEGEQAAGIGVAASTEAAANIGVVRTAV